jgi:fucose permease
MILLRASLASLAFVSLGLPDGLLGVAWPSIRRTFGLDLDAVGALLAATTIGYVSSSFTSGRLVRRFNVGLLVASSCALTGLALLGYATVPAWALLIALGGALGLGAGAVDASLNTYAATRHGHGMLNWLHACYGIGAAAGPFLMTAVLGRGLPWERGYLLVAIGQLLLAGAFVATLRWWPAPGPSGHDAEHASIGATLRVGSARLGVVVFFLYAGVEASMGLWTYTLLVEGRGVSAAGAAWAVTLFWGGLTAGRLLAAGAAGRVQAVTLLRGCIAGVIIGVMLVWLDRGFAATAFGVALAGTACGPVFPTLIATTPGRVGAGHAANAVGFQVGAAAAGLAVLPAAVGAVAAATTVPVIATLLVILAVLLAAAYGWLVAASAAESGPVPRTMA